MRQTFTTEPTLPNFQEFSNLKEGLNPPTIQPRHNKYQDKPKDGKISANQNKASVDETKGPGSSNSSAAMDDGGSHVRLQCTGVSNGKQKIEECAR